MQEILLEVPSQPDYIKRTLQEYYTNENQRERLIGEGYTLIDPFASEGMAVKTVYVPAT